MKRVNYLVIIQARLGSTRFPNKVMQTVGGIPMVKRVWNTARSWQGCIEVFDKTVKVVVAWPERYPDLNENNVLERFKRVMKEFPSDHVIRLTADCPLLTTADIDLAVKAYLKGCSPYYYSNHLDGHDVQVFKSNLFELYPSFEHKEHVIADFYTESTGLSVNTKQDLERVRRICTGK